MKLNTPSQIALFISVGTALSVGIFLVLFMWMLGVAVVWWTWFVLVGVVFGVAFGLAWWAIEKFLHSKIKMLYRSIQGPERVDGRMREVIKSRDVLGTVQKDVEEWASVKQREIQSLKEQANYRRDFIGNLAHELKTPIFNMQGYLLTLIEGGLDDPKINHDYLDRADKNLERLISLVEDLDSITKLESGRELLKFEKTNLVEICEEVFKLHTDRAEEKNITLRLDRKYEKPIWVKADREKLVQVLSNLVLNAIYYGKFDGHCEVRVLDMDQNVLVEVADDGIGVQPEHLPRLFERFYRVDKSRARNQGGSGLGLAIVKHIIESHGQSINVRSAPDQGTTFFFTLEKTK